MRRMIDPKNIPASSQYYRHTITAFENDLLSSNISFIIVSSKKEPYTTISEVKTALENGAVAIPDIYNTSMLKLACIYSTNFSIALVGNNGNYFTSFNQSLVNDVIKSI